MTMWRHTHGRQLLLPGWYSDGRRVAWWHLIAYAGDRRLRPRLSDLRELAAAMAADDGWSDGDIRDVQLAAEEIERLRAELADIRKRRSVWPPADDEDE